MARTVRTILYTANESAAPELRRAITSLPQLRIVAELDEASLLPQAVAQFPCDVIIADLDPNAAMVIECLRQLRETETNLPIFALSKQTEGDVVLSAMKAGVKEYLVKPLNVEELEQAISRIAASRSSAKQPGKLISVMGSSGGVGCTTIATNLAVELADLVEDDEKVAIVDLDFRFGHVATLLDVHGQYTVADLCSTQEELDPQMIMRALIKHETGVYVLRRPQSFAQAEMITAAHCANVLTSLQAMCEYVVVDGPTRHDPGGRSVLDAADYNFLVLQLLVTSVRNTDRMVQELGTLGFNSSRISLVCNRIGRESAHLELEQVEMTLNRKMFATISDDWKSVSASINIGQPLMTFAEKVRVRQEIRDLARLIHTPEEAADSAKKGGIFGRIFGKGAGDIEENANMGSTGTERVVQG
ncbi:MAG: CpaE family protein [Phycisphaerae bacterium]